MSVRLILILAISSSTPLVAQTPGACAEAAADAHVTLFGRALDEDSGVALPDARVTAAWAAEAGEEVQAEVRTRPDGSYRLCGLPLGLPITLQATFGDRATEPVTARLESPPVTYDFQVPAASAAAGARLEARARQGPGRVLGRVRDAESLEPVEDAVVTLRRADPVAGGGEPGLLQALSDSQGRFLLKDLPGGTYALELRHVAYGTVREPLQVPASRTLEVELRVPPVAIEMEPLVVTTVRDRRLEIKGFYERKEWGEKLGLGHFFDRDDIERRNPLRITHLVADVPGVRLRCGYRSRTCYARSIRAPLSCSRLNVYVDGVRVLDGDQRPSAAEMQLDEFVSPTEVGGVEVYTSTAELPGEFSGSTGQCGAVVVWTRR